MKPTAFVLVLALASPAAAQPVATSSCAARLQETADDLRLALEDRRRCEFQLDTCHMREGRMREVVDNPPVPEEPSKVPLLVIGLLIPVTALATFLVGLQVGQGTAQ